MCTNIHVHIQWRRVKVSPRVGESTVPSLWNTSVEVIIWWGGPSDTMGTSHYFFNKLK